MKYGIAIFGITLLLAMNAKAQKVTTQVCTLKKITEYDKRNLSIEGYNDTIRYIVVPTMTRLVDSSGKQADGFMEKGMLTLDSMRGTLAGLDDEQLLSLYSHPTYSIGTPSGYRGKRHPTGTYPLVTFIVDVPYYRFSTAGGRIVRTDYFVQEKKPTSVLSYLLTIFGLMVDGVFLGYAFFIRKRGFLKATAGMEKEERNFRRMGYPIVITVFLWQSYCTMTENLTGHYFRYALSVWIAVILGTALSARIILRWLARFAAWLKKPSRGKGLMFQS